MFSLDLCFIIFFFCLKLHFTTISFISQFVFFCHNSVHNFFLLLHHLGYFSYFMFHPNLCFVRGGQPQNTLSCWKNFTPKKERRLKICSSIIWCKENRVKHSFLNCYDTWCQNVIVWLLGRCRLRLENCHFFYMTKFLGWSCLPKKLCNFLQYQICDNTLQMTKYNNMKSKSLQYPYNTFIYQQ